MDKIARERREDEPQTIHGVSMMNSMNQEMERKNPRVIWKPVVLSMEEESVEVVFAQRPPYDSKKEGPKGPEPRQQLLLTPQAIDNRRYVAYGDQVPRSRREDL